MNLNNTPVLKSIYEYGKSGVIPFHMPGHKKGNIFSKLGIEALALDMLVMDTTEVPGIDNLHCPEHAISEAQDLAASAFGADHTFFLVNGTTCGIYSMIMGTTNPGDKIIIPRNSHRSVTGAVILGRLIPVYINPEVDEELNIAMGVSPEAVEEAITRNPDAKAVVLTNPTFYGACSDIRKIADMVHRHGMLLLVDEAHGAHFAFHKALPTSALAGGADIVAQSTHKTLPAMTQGSMLHVKSKGVDMDKLKFFLQLSQSTSPSHLILASLDLARYIMQENGEELLHETICQSSNARRALNNIPGIYCLDDGRLGKYAVREIDQTRLTVCFRGCGVSGSEADKILRKDFKIQVEMADLYNIVAITTIGDEEKYFQRFVEGVAAVAGLAEAAEKRAIADRSGISFRHKQPSLAYMPWEAAYMDREYVHIESCVGKVCGEIIVPYPPGIPVIMPGEVIDRETVEYISACAGSGINISGMHGSRIAVLKK